MIIIPDAEQIVTTHGLTTKMAQKNVEHNSNSLRETLKELENPACSVSFADPEDDDDTYTTARVLSWSSSQTEGDTDAPHFGNLRRKTANSDLINCPKYSGSKISRKQLADWNEG